MRPIYVKWHDATSSDEWTDDAEAMAESITHVIHTFGVLVKEDSEKLIIAMNRDQDRGAVSMTMTIPLTWVIHREWIDIDITKPPEPPIPKRKPKKKRVRTCVR